MSPERTSRSRLLSLVTPAAFRAAPFLAAAAAGGLWLALAGGPTQAAALAVAAKVKLFTNATSLGGCESLIEHRASVEGEHPLSPQNLLRISVGLEHPEDLVADLHQALD